MLTIVTLRKFLIILKYHILKLLFSNVSHYTDLQVSFFIALAGISQS